MDNNLDYGSEKEKEEEEEDEEGELLNEKVEKKFFETITAIREGDKEAKDPAKNYFSEEDFEEEENTSKKKEKPIYYKDLIREKMLKKQEKSEKEDEGEGEDKEKDEDADADAEAEAEAEAEEKEGEDEKIERKKKMDETFNEEQKRLKEEFLKEVDKAEGQEGDLFKVREKTKTEVDAEVKDFKEFMLVLVIVN